jgi:hypothetical protein
VRIDGHGNVMARRVICTMFVISRDVVLGKKVVVETDVELRVGLSDLFFHSLSFPGYRLLTLKN